MNIVYVLAAFCIGMLFATQPAINSEVAKIFGGPVPAASVSVAITLMACLIVLPFFGPFSKTARFCWASLGGVAGWCDRGLGCRRRCGNCSGDRRGRLFCLLDCGPIGRFCLARLFRRIWRGSKTGQPNKACRNWSCHGGGCTG